MGARRTQSPGTGCLPSARARGRRAPHSSCNNKSTNILVSNTKRRQGRWFADVLAEGHDHVSVLDAGDAEATDGRTRVDDPLLQQQQQVKTTRHTRYRTDVGNAIGEVLAHLDVRPELRAQLCLGVCLLCIRWEMGNEVLDVLSRGETTTRRERRMRSLDSECSRANTDLDSVSHAHRVLAAVDQKLNVLVELPLQISLEQLAHAYTCV